MRKGQVKMIKGPDPVFFHLLANLAHNNSVLPRIISTYLERNPQLCSISTKAETCSSWMRDMALAGNAQNIKAMIEFCRPELMAKQLQDIISEFCHEPLFHAALAPAQQMVHKIVHYSTFNLTVANHLSLPFVVKSQNLAAPASISTYLLLALSSMLIIMILAGALFRGRAGLIHIAETSGYWLWGSRRQPSQKVENPLIVNQVDSHFNKR